MKRTELRLPDDLYEHYRAKAYDLKSSLNKEIVKALEDAKTNNTAQEGRKDS